MRRGNLTLAIQKASKLADYDRDKTQSKKRDGKKAWGTRKTKEVKAGRRNRK